MLLCVGLVGTVAVWVLAPVLAASLTCLGLVYLGWELRHAPLWPEQSDEARAREALYPRRRG